MHLATYTRTNGQWNTITAPMQTNGDNRIPLAVAHEAHKEYAAQGNSQSLARINERGGFGASELAILLYERIKRLEQTVAANCGAKR